MREKEGEERWNKSSFWNQKLISKETNFKKFTFEETVCYVGMSELFLHKSYAKHLEQMYEHNTWLHHHK